MNYIVWTPAPEEISRVLIRSYPLAPFPPKQLVPGDYVFFCQEDIVLQPGESRALPLDADISTFGQVNHLLYPLPGYSWYHPSIGRSFSSANGYHRLFQHIIYRNTFDIPLRIPAGTAACRIVMDRLNIDDPNFIGDPSVPSVPMSIYLSITMQEAAIQGPTYYTHSDLAPVVPFDATLGQIRSFTNNAAFGN